MPGIITPPTAPGKIGWNGQALKTIDPKTGLTIVVGAGLQGSVPLAGGQLELDALRVDSPEVWHHYRAGAVAAVTLGTWSNTRASRKALVAAMEANLGTAQTTADPANYWALKIADSGGLNAVLPFSSVASHFTLNQSSGQIIAATAKQNTAGAGARDNSHNGVMQQFRPTQQLTVTGVYWRGGWTDASNIGKALQTRCTLMDDSMNVLAVAYATTGAQNDNKLFFAFPLAVVLASGTTYRVAVDIFATMPAAGIGLWQQISGTGQSAPITVVGAGWGMNGFTLPVGYAGQWADAFRDFPAAVNAGADDMFGLGQETGLLGSGAGAVLNGDLTLSLVAVGAPLGTAAGSDLNARVLLNPA